MPLARIQMVMGETGRTPDEGYTAGSKTIETSGMILRRVAATARAALLEMAASELNATLDELAVRDGVITLRDQPGPRVSYAGLIAADASTATSPIPPRSSDQRTTNSLEPPRPGWICPRNSPGSPHTSRTCGCPDAARAARATAAPRRDAGERGRAESVTRVSCAWTTSSPW